MGLQVTQALLFKGLARCFQAWQHHAQVSSGESSCSSNHMGWHDRYPFLLLFSTLRRPDDELRNVQDVAMKRLAFQRKQRAIHDALRIGAQIARRNRRQLVTAVFVAWRLQSRVFRALRRHLAARQAASLHRVWQGWRDWTVERVRHAITVQQLTQRDPTLL